jgi:predicted transcriptional regulator
MKINEKIINLLKERKEPLTPKEIENSVKINRAVLLGYLRCLTDLEIIKSKDSGKAKIYFYDDLDLINKTRKKIEMKERTKKIIE